jgi:antirestriction protein
MKTIETQGFFYIDGIPTKGAWIDLDTVTDWDEIKEQLGARLEIKADDIDEVLCADIEGIARHFYFSNCDGFDLKEWAEFKEEINGTHLDIEVIDAYFEHCGTGGVTISMIEDAYAGEYDTWEDFAYDLLESTGDLDQIPESLRSYFDYASFGRDLSYDYFESNGHYFRNC